MASVRTEGDILKCIIKRGQITALLKELNTEILSSPRAANAAAPAEDDPQRQQMRQCAKIWTALGKLVRS